MQNIDFKANKRKFYNSKEWRTLRKRYVDNRITIDGGLCEICRQSAGEEVHHITPITPKNLANTKITLDEENLKFVCRECHHRNEKSRIAKYEPVFGVQSGCYLDENGKLTQQEIKIVWGAPFAGKSTYVQENMEHGDFVVDLTRMFKIFSEHSQENFPNQLFGNVMDIRDFIYNQVQSGRINAKTIWLIEGLPKSAIRAKRKEMFPQAEFIFIDKDKEYCVYKVEKSKRVKNKYKMCDFITKWFETFEP